MRGSPGPLAVAGRGPVDGGRLDRPPTEPRTGRLVSLVGSERNEMASLFNHLRLLFNLYVTNHILTP
jgi:hypothetical protein